MIKRYAIVRGARDSNEVQAYLPANYELVGTAVERTEQFSAVHPDGQARLDRLVFVVGGRDDAGWTLDGYVIPRLGSGVMTAEEIDLSHPVMKAIPA